MADEYAKVEVPSGPQGLLPIATNKIYKARDGNVAQKLAYDVSGYGLNEVRKFLVAITGNEIEAQIALDNPPAFADVDGVRGKGIAYAERRVTVSFGMRLKMQALIDLKAALKSAIERSTTTTTGTLSDMGNWEYRYVRNGHVQPLPVAGSSGIPMGPQDFIILAPKQVFNKKGQNYATAANMRVAGSGKLTFRRSQRSRPKTRDQSIGYLALTARSAKVSSAFGGFSVTANFTTRYHMAGEVTRLGGVRTGYLKIRPKTGRR